MVSTVEVRHLNAVIVLAEELSFTRAAQRLHITQSALSKQIAEIEVQHRFHLFTRDDKRNVNLTDVGRVFVEEARSALLHIERAVRFGRAARDGSDYSLTIGLSPYIDQAWISDVLAIRLPLYPELRIQLKSEFSSELVRGVLSGELNMALVTAPLEDSRITVASFALTPLYAVLPDTHAAAKKERIGLDDLANDDWILLARRTHPLIHGAIMDAARREGISPKSVHDILTTPQAVHLVSEHVGVAIVIRPTAVGVVADGVVEKPLSDATLSFATAVVMRADDDSRVTNDFARCFLRRHQPRRMSSSQMELALSA